MSERGFTLPEMLALIWVLICLAIPFALLYALVHFVLKFW